jgi:hypothetical protein
MRLSARLVVAAAGLLAGVPVATNAAARTKPGTVRVAQVSAGFGAKTTMLRMRSLPAGQATD